VEIQDEGCAKPVIDLAFHCHAFDTGQTQPFSLLQIRHQKNRAAPKNIHKKTTRIGRQRHLDRMEILQIIFVVIEL